MAIFVHPAGTYTLSCWWQLLTQRRNFALCFVSRLTRTIVKNLDILVTKFDKIFFLLSAKRLSVMFSFDWVEKNVVKNHHITSNAHLTSIQPPRTENFLNFTFMDFRFDYINLHRFILHWIAPLYIKSPPPLSFEVNSWNSWYYNALWVNCSHSPLKSRSTKNARSFWLLSANVSQREFLGIISNFNLHSRVKLLPASEKGGLIGQHESMDF